MMINRRTIWAMLAGFAIAFAAPTAMAQGIITQWNFTPGFSTTSPVPSLGFGTAALVGGTTATSAGGLTNSGSTEAVAGSTAWNTSTYAAAGTGSGTRGISFLVDTTGLSNMVFRYDVRYSNTSSRFAQVEVTTDGGTSWQPLQINEALIGGDSWTNNRTVDISSLSAANNNPNFGVRIVAIFDPNGTDYAATATTYGPTGTLRYDAVTVSSGNVWTGATNSDFSVGANYAGGVAPAGTTNTLLLGGSGVGNPVINIGTSSAVDQVIFQTGGPAYNLNGGPNVLTVNAGVINNSGQTHTFNTGVTFGQSNSIFTSADSNMVFNEPINFNNFIKLFGPGAITLNNSVQGTFTGLTTGNPTVPTILVSGGATVFGTGAIGGLPNNNLQVNANSRLQPGSNTAIGTLQVTGNVQLLNESNYGIKIIGGIPSATPGGSTTGTLPNPDSNNFLNIIGGSATINAGTNFIIDGTGMMFVLNTEYSYEIMNGAGNQAALFINDPARFNTIGFDADMLSVTGTADGRVFLNFTPIPEPMLGLLALPLALFARRRSTR